MPAFFSEEVEGALEGEGYLRHAEAAKGPGGRVVRIHGQALDLGISVSVGAGHMDYRALEHGAAEGGVGARVRDDASLNAEEPALGVAADPHVDVHRVALHVHPRALLPAQAALDRPLGEEGEEGRVVLDRLVLLAAEGPAHVGRSDPHILFGQAEGMGDIRAPRIDVLLASAHEDLSLSVGRKGQGAFRLHKSVVGKGRMVARLDHMGRPFEGCPRVASLKLDPREQVPARMEAGSAAC
jgi:hypothetical protein